jgi:hypothetical protein
MMAFEHQVNDRPHGMARKGRSVEEQSVTKRSWTRYRLARRLAIILAAAPLFQISQCMTGINQTFMTFANNAPSTYFQVLNSLALLPIQLLFGLNTQGFGGTGSGNSSGTFF